jgi:hypothetical protein
MIRPNALASRRAVALVAVASMAYALAACSDPAPAPPAIPNPTPATEAIHFAGPISGTLTSGRNRYEPGAVEPSPTIYQGQTRTTECYEWHLSDGTPEWEVHVYGSVGSAGPVEIQMAFESEGGEPVAGRHELQVYGSGAMMEVIPDAVISDTSQWWGGGRATFDANHESYFTVDASERSGTVDAYLLQTNNQFDDTPILHVSGRWSC